MKGINETAQEITDCFFESEALTLKLATLIEEADARPLVVGFAMALMEKFLRDNFKEGEWDKILRFSKEALQQIQETTEGELCGQKPIYV